ncbi:hypothetical protein PoB_005377900 [Plakobranchus ocellatus]|uniref:Uncharacterized protein n=1 Tax=Plakobranchus ocellatus TaxID=259542 RepID=A0AAV4C401_9GAST|nr:hypothetical protein PoB_005377900 [Plakobranchus ocellatus]
MFAPAFAACPDERYKATMIGLCNKHKLHIDLLDHYACQRGKVISAKSSRPIFSQFSCNVVDEDDKVGGEDYQTFWPPAFCDDQSPAALYLRLIKRGMKHIV